MSELIRGLVFRPNTRILVVFERLGSIAFYWEDKRVDPVFVMAAWAKGYLRLEHAEETAPYRTAMGTELRLKGITYHLVSTQAEIEVTQK